MPELSLSLYYAQLDRLTDECGRQRSLVRLGVSLSLIMLASPKPQARRPNFSGQIGQARRQCTEQSELERKKGPSLSDNRCDDRTKGCLGTCEEWRRRCRQGGILAYVSIVVR